MNQYRRRLIEKRIERALKSSGAVALKGPKFCGKTTTCRLYAKSEIQLITTPVIELAKADPAIVLNGEQPRLIDEWQVIPGIWDHVRSAVDRNQSFGEYLLTGSATPADEEEIHHSGAGRIVPLVMRTMSLFESNDSKGTISLSYLFENPTSAIADLNEKANLEEIAFCLCRGGWPLSVQEDKEVALDVTSNYFDGLFDVSRNKKEYRGKNPITLRRVLKSYARNVSTEASLQTILRDVAGDGEEPIDIKTLQSYLQIAQDLFIIEDMEAWSPNLRSKATVRTTPTRHFVDPSIACQALGATLGDLLSDANLFGLLFEDLAVRDLRIYAEQLEGTLRHYRDSNGLECDAVIHLKNGKWAPIEVKLGSPESIEFGAKKLQKLVDGLDEKYPKPTFMMVLTATGPAYRRADGVYVVPINLLRD